MGWGICKQQQWQQQQQQHRATVSKLEKHTHSTNRTLLHQTWPHAGNANLMFNLLS
jgi:hypothetical protein